MAPNGKARRTKLTTQFVIGPSMIACGQAKYMPDDCAGRNRYRNDDDRFAKAGNRALLIAHSAGKTHSTQVQVECNAIIVQRNRAMILDSQADRKAGLHASSFKRLKPGNGNSQRLLRPESRTRGKAKNQGRYNQYASSHDSTCGNGEIIPEYLTLFC